MSGWTDFPLSDRGERQARRVAARLSNEHLPLHALYASPLRRAASTAEPISCATGLSITLVDGLREINCGLLDGEPIETVRTKYPHVWAENLRQNNEHFRWPGGESYREFRDRCFTNLRTIASRHDRERVGVVTHAGVISQVFGALHGESPAAWEPFRPGMTSLNELIWRDRPFEAISFDDAAHLQT